MSSESPRPVKRAAADSEGDQSGTISQEPNTNLNNMDDVPKNDTARTSVETPVANNSAPLLPEAEGPQQSPISISPFSFSPNDRAAFAAALANTVNNPAELLDASYWKTVPAHELLQIREQERTRPSCKSTSTQMNDIKGLLFDLCEQRKLVGETGPLADLAGKIRLERSMEPRPPTKIDALLDKMGPLVEAEWNARGSDELVKELEETATTTVTA